MRKGWKAGLIVIFAAVLVILLCVAVASRRIPLGVPGEWEWLRVHLRPTLGALSLAALGVAAYAGFAAIGLRSLLRDAVDAAREFVWLAWLLVAAVAIQVVIPTGAADEYDLTKWAYVNYFGSSTGYYQVARKQVMSDPWRFLANYPIWIQSQDSLHIGTHPPGLITWQCFLLRAMEARPGASDLLMRIMPSSTFEGFRQLERMDRRSIPRVDRAALYASSLITLLACAGTVVPVYLLARASLSAPASWATASFWPLVPAANLFQPDSDTAFPFFSTLALALAAWSARCQSGGGARGTSAGLTLAVISGTVLAAGMFFTLAFLPVGLIVALMIASGPVRSWGWKVGLIAAIGVGFLISTAAIWSFIGANPIPVWVWNLKNHARFYVEYPRTYAVWLLVNPVELAVALGLPAVVWGVVGVARPRSLTNGFWATLAVLLILNLAGKNMGEVARLWLLFMPPLLIAAGAGMTRLSGGPLTLAASLSLMGAQTLALQAMIQVVYPV